MNLALEGIELEGLGDLDELELLGLGKLRGEPEGCEIIENDLFGNIKNGRQGSRLGAGKEEAFCIGDLLGRMLLQ